MSSLQDHIAAYMNRHPLPAPGGVNYRSETIAAISGEWISRKNEATSLGTLVYLHGGGPAALALPLVLQGWRVFVPNYSTAPEHHFPTGLQDAVAVWRSLSQSLPSTERFVIAGASAGSNLALSLMLHEKEAGLRLPDAAALFSSATQFLASPLLGNLEGLPPILIHAAVEEALRDDSSRFSAKAREAGVRVQLQLWPTIPQGWQAFYRMPEVKQSFNQASTFLKNAQPLSAESPEEVDVLIIGAGLSGIGAASHLQMQCPEQTTTILESRKAMGGTWDLFRYPGVRSDSDMYTLGYNFKPWKQAKAIADGAAIRAYIQETATERGLNDQIRYNHKVIRMNWSTDQQLWQVWVERGSASELVQINARFINVCSGYYSYQEAHRPTFPDEHLFKGAFVHPQFWPANLELTGKKVIVIGSGATAVTLVPALSKQAQHVTMLQRNPTYIVNYPSVDPIAEGLKRFLPDLLAYRLVRTKNILLQQAFYKIARKWPEATKNFIVRHAHRQVSKHQSADDFSPRYQPWDQRLCTVPDSDLFRAIRSGKAAVVTDQIAGFTSTGIRLQSGKELDADIVVTATGLKIEMLGGIQICVDNQPIEPKNLMGYKAMMFSGIPNLIMTFGYTNASWTLKADLTAAWMCRLLKHMKKYRLSSATPIRDPSVKEQPFLDFTSGYVQRAIQQLPKQGDRKPWRVYQNFFMDLITLRYSRLDDGALKFKSKQS